MRWSLKRSAGWFVPVLLSLCTGGLLILAVGQDPLLTYANLFTAGFGCQPGPGRCALVTALQFATPLLLSGLSATMALRSGFLSVGQFGQMLFGAAAASWLAGEGSLPPVLHPALALAGAAFLGGVWGLLPAILKSMIGVNEILSTLLLNPIAGVLVGLVWYPRIAASAHLLPLLPGTKLSAGLFLALAAALLVYIFLWRTTRGVEIRAAAHAPRFALYAGMPVRGPVLLAMTLSGALAGLAGGVEVLGVHYQFISSFSAVNEFDGLIVAVLGGLHPAGVMLFAFLLGGLRTGSIVGLQMQSGIPRELGSALIAFLLLFAATHRYFYSGNEGEHAENSPSSS